MPANLIGRVGFGALLLALFLAPALGGFPAGASYRADVPLSALRCLVIVAGMCLLPQFPRATGNRIWAVVFAGVWATVGWTVLSLLVASRFLTSPVLLFAMLPAALDWVCFGILFTLSARLAEDRKAAQFLIGALITGAVWAAIRSVQEYGGFVQDGAPGQRAQGTFFSPNFAAGLMALLLPAVVAWCLSVKNRLAALALGAAAALMLGALFASGSRAAVALTALTLLIALLFSFPRFKALPGAWVRVAAVLVAFALVGFAFRGPLLRRVETSGQEQSGPFRTWTWKGTVQMAANYPLLGAGPGTFPYVYPRYALVARTDLAHSSYLQLAAEQGYPALVLAALTLAGVVSVGAGGLLRALRSPDTDPLFHLLWAGLLAGFLAGLGRSLVDSEWSLLGNAFPFWAVAGLLLAFPAGSSVPASSRATVPTPPEVDWYGVGGTVALIPALILAFLCLKAAQTRDSVLAALREKRTTAIDTSVWPPQPLLLLYDGKGEAAAEIEPTGKRYYQLAILNEQKGDLAQVVQALKQSVAREPGSLQAWRRLAEAQEKIGDTAGAQESWRKLVAQQEGPVGQIRAIPEMTDTNAAFAYHALARTARQNGETALALAHYEKAAQVVEKYSRMAPLYQQMEVLTAGEGGVNLEARRQEIRALYENIIQEWNALAPEKTAERTTRRDETLARLDAFLKPDAATRPPTS